MCGRLLRLWHASYGYRGRVASRDEGSGAVDVDRYTPVVRRGGCPRARGIGEACNSSQGSSRRGVVGVSSDVRVQRRRRRFQAERCRSLL